MKTKLFVFLLTSSLLSSCIEDDFVTEGLNTGTVLIDTSARVESKGMDQSIAYLSGRVTNSGKLEVRRGVILDTVGGVMMSGEFSNPDSLMKYSFQTKADAIGGGGRFTIEMETPVTKTRYYYRFFVKNYKGTTLSPVDSFISAPDLPLTSDVFLIIPSRDSVQLGAFLSENGGDLLESKGFVASKLGNSTIQNGIVVYASPDSSKTFFRATIKGLEPKTNYKVRAFAKNRGGIKYSKDASFTTLP